MRDDDDDCPACRIVRAGFDGSTTRDGIGPGTELPDRYLDSRTPRGFS